MGISFVITFDNKGDCTEIVEGITFTLMVGDKERV